MVAGGCQGVRRCLQNHCCADIKPTHDDHSKVLSCLRRHLWWEKARRVITAHYSYSSFDTISMVMSKQAWAEEAKAALDAKAKPPGSLGLLEEWAVRLCALQETLRPSGGPVATLIFAADHGVTKTHPVRATLTCDIAIILHYILPNKL